MLMLQESCEQHLMNRQEIALTSLLQHAAQLLVADGSAERRKPTGRMLPLFPVYPLVKLWFDDKRLRHTTFLPVQPGSSADALSTPLESPISA